MFGCREKKKNRGKSKKSVFGLLLFHRFLRFSLLPIVVKGHSHL
ncbi:unnamed protein product, partial [Vitis vinifera]|uniref:Uncharacterized protein n=1 Tax=Vitis vinifera TaxID=29760 RepID=D7SUD0_VITVI